MSMERLSESLQRDWADDGVVRDEEPVGRLLMENVDISQPGIQIIISHTHVTEADTTRKSVLLR